ncbi:oxidoreductase C-terminal domain-containing protein [Arthrobacter sp. U41]|uniref:oxidoreductase C-terminal domain-containing protein n=1 Tax=Arthrobacter sp. U41 TaxID=1849032 RepID=UPI0009F363D5
MDLRSRHLRDGRRHALHQHHRRCQPAPRMHPEGAHPGRQGGSAHPGQPAADPDIAWFWTVQHGVRLQTAGVRHPDDEVFVRGDPAGGRFSAVYLRNGRLAAVDTVGGLSDFRPRATSSWRRRSSTPWPNAARTNWNSRSRRRATRSADRGTPASSASARNSTGPL